MLEQAHKDSLTGFYERESLILYLNKLISDAEKGEKGFSLAILDLDHFKRFNDKYGHPFGDEILKYATSTLRLTFYEGQCVFFRYGGDEFVAVFPQKETREAQGLIRQAQYNLRRRPCLFENKFYSVTLSGGIAGFPQDAQSAEELIQRADAAMYFSKRSGRNFTTPFNRIAYLKMRRAANLAATIAAVVAVGSLMYHLMYQRIIQPTVRQIQHIKITTKPENLDTVVLKSGGVFEGKVLAQTAQKVVLNVYFDAGGECEMVFNRSEIAQVKHSGKEKKK